jgi:uncharacterized ubiquitin-like protein YukD
MILIFESCRLTYDCPGYNISDKTIISFRQGDTIFYSSDNKDTLALIVTDFYAQEPYSFKSTPIMDYECYPLAFYITSKDDKTGIFIKETHDWQNCISFGDDDSYNLPWARVLDSYKKEYDYDALFEKEKNIRNFIYNYVWEVKDLSNKRRIDRFIKVHYYGIIEFHDKHTDITWIQIIK